MLYQLS